VSIDSGTVAVALVRHLWPSEAPRWLGAIKITWIRAASAVAFSVCIEAGINDSSNSHSHKMLTYIAWYGAAVLCLAVVVITTVLIERQLHQQPQFGGLRLVDRLNLALSEGLALVPRLNPATPTLDVLQAARAWQDATYAMLAAERRDLAERFLDTGEPIEERETQSLSTVNPARFIMERQATVLTEIIEELEAEKGEVIDVY
jgi:hypothetical protein